MQAEIDDVPGNESDKHCLRDPPDSGRKMADDNEQERNGARESEEVNEDSADQVRDGKSVVIDVMIARVKEIHIIRKEQEQRRTNTFQNIACFHVPTF